MVDNNDTITSEEADILETIGIRMIDSRTPEITFKTKCGVDVMFLHPLDYKG